MEPTQAREVGGYGQVVDHTDLLEYSNRSSSYTNASLKVLREKLCLYIDAFLEDDSN